MDKRLGTALVQYARDNNLESGLAHRAQVAIEECGQLLGPRSSSRVARLRLGKALMDSSLRPEVWVPVCPDYSGDADGYRFDDLHSGVSLLARRHIAFLAMFFKSVPGAQMRVMYADLEARDLAIQRSCGIGHQVFLQRIDASIEATRKVLEGPAWEVSRMTDVVGDLDQHEEAAELWLLMDPDRVQRLARDSVAREDLYARIDPNLTPQQRFDRTLKTAAQYLALGREANRRGALICGHTTTNLHWYSVAGAALVHNDVRIYKTRDVATKSTAAYETPLAV